MWAIAELDIRQEAWRQKYLEQLCQLNLKDQAAGDLDQILVIKQEVETGGVSIDPRYASFKRLQGIYDTRRQQLEQATLLNGVW